MVLCSILFKIIMEYIMQKYSLSLRILKKRLFEGILTVIMRGQDSAKNNETHSAAYKDLVNTSSKFLPEVQNIFPSVQSLAVTEGKMIEFDSIPVNKPVICINVFLRRELGSTEKDKLTK